MERIRREERGDTLVNWVVLAVGLAAAGAALVALLKPAIQTGGQNIVELHLRLRLGDDFVRRRLACERGDASSAGLSRSRSSSSSSSPAQALAYAHARSVAAAAAQDGAAPPRPPDPKRGSRASAILAAAGGTGESLRASAREEGDEVTVSVEGEAPRLCRSRSSSRR